MISLRDYLYNYGMATDEATLLGDAYESEGLLGVEVAARRLGYDDSKHDYTSGFVEAVYDWEKEARCKSQT